MTENISNLIVAFFSLLGAIIVALWAGLTIWAFRDIRSRTRDPFVQILATVVVGVIPIAGILVYFMLRPRETLAEQYVRALEEESLLASIENQEFCPTCGRRVEGDMQFCPACHAKLRNSCGNCGRAVHLSWDLCPYCGNGLTPEAPAATVTKPQPKQMAAPSTAAAVATTAAKVSVIDRMGGAIGGMIDKVSPPKATDAPAAGSAGDGTANAVAPPPKPNGAPPKAAPVRKPPQPEELE
jgi:RNA polymerase subunit RPABC4/transcription elongation factor Spt4